MPIIWKHGNIFDTKHKNIIIPVNCVGRMGAGLAYEFAQRHPQLIPLYQALCAKHIIRIGNIGILVDQSIGMKFFMFPTKEHYAKPSQYEYIDLGLNMFCSSLKKYEFSEPIAFPLLGTGFGGLDKCKVKKMMASYLSTLPIEIEIWEH